MQPASCSRATPRCESPPALAAAGSDQARQSCEGIVCVASLARSSGLLQMTPALRGGGGYAGRATPAKGCAQLPCGSAFKMPSIPRACLPWHRGICCLGSTRGIWTCIAVIISGTWWCEKPLYVLTIPWHPVLGAGRVWDCPDRGFGAKGSAFGWVQIAAAPGEATFDSQ